jgi:succinate dehydrogenase / fumarate reductase cytochrome b subunit
MPRPANTDRIPSNWLRWFDPRRFTVGSIAFIMNRVAGLGLTLYLFLHLVMLGQLASGPQAYDGFIALVKSPLFLLGEFLVVAAVFLHGFNGIRIAITSLGIGARNQKSLFFGFTALALAGCIYFAIRMFGGE